MLSTGWYRASDGVEERDNALILSRLCALQWIVVLYEHVVPNSLKAEVNIITPFTCIDLAANAWSVLLFLLVC